MEPLELRIQKDLTNSGYNQVRSVIVEEGPDATGDNSLFVWILMDDALTDTDLSWEKIKHMVDEARNEARDANPHLYPYVRVRRVREWEELVGQ